ncbi:hypothetical protein OIU78_006552 [Salix suchowensis]|nr:hypothetical protein OIU78_006552 [Salix suchowensis]
MYGAPKWRSEPGEKGMGVLGETGPGSSVTSVWISLKEEQQNLGDGGCDLGEEGYLEGDLNQLGHMNERKEEGMYLGVEKASGVVGKGLFGAARKTIMKMGLCAIEAMII